MIFTAIDGYTGITALILLVALAALTVVNEG